MTVQELIAIIETIGTDATAVLNILKTYVPNQELAAIANLADLIIPITEQLAANGLTAWSNASGQAITVQSVQALMPDPTPLPPPTQ